MEAPNVITKRKIGDLTFQVKAYRTLTKAEMDQAYNKYLQDLKKQRKSAPKSGTVTVIAIHGFDQ